MNRISRLFSAFIVSIAMILTPSSAADTAASDRERISVLDVVQKFFDTMASRDVDGAKAILLSDGQYYAVRNETAGTALQRRTHEEYLARMATGNDHPLERMWDATVMIHDRIAMVWAPYDFHRNGKFSHSGVDVFTLVRTDSGWKIAGLVFTVDPNTPSQHPSGPPPAATVK